MTARDTLLDAAKALIWRQGVEATSPADLLAESGVGQGSLYHHFRGKTAWAGAAIAALADDLQAETEALIDPAERPRGLGRLEAFLGKPRAALDGCRLGRLAFDPAVLADPDLGAPIRGYTDSLLARLTSAVAAAQAAGDVRASVDPAALAATLAATVQGGYVLARMTGDPAAMTTALTGLAALLKETT